MLLGRTHVVRTVAFLSRVHVSQTSEHFLAQEFRGHVETKRRGPASNVHIPELGHQRCVPLGVSTMTFVLLVFLILFDPVVRSRYSSRYSGCV